MCIPDEPARVGPGYVEFPDTEAYRPARECRDGGALRQKHTPAEFTAALAHHDRQIALAAEAAALAPLAPVPAAWVTDADTPESHRPVPAPRPKVRPSWRSG